MAQLACCAGLTSLLLSQLLAAMQVLHARHPLRPGPGCCLAESPPQLPGCQQQHPGVQPGLCWLLLRRPAALELLPELQSCRAAALQAHDAQLGLLQTMLSSETVLHCKHCASDICAATLCITLALGHRSAKMGIPLVTVQPADTHQPRLALSTLHPVPWPPAARHATVLWNRCITNLEGLRERTSPAPLQS